MTRRPVSSDWPVDGASVGTGLPLEGVRVLDLSRVLAGPLAAMVVGDLGADVIKVEPPGGDPVRGFDPPSIDGEATYFLAVNRNRRGIVADLTTTEGRALVRSLARSADAVIENFLPRQRAAFGLDTLRDELDDVVWVTVSPATSSGVLGDQPSFDLLAQARSGIMGVTGSTESGPMKVGAPIADVVTGLYGAIALLAGLYARTDRPEDRARRFEVPLLESTMVSLVNQVAGYLVTGRDPQLLGNEHPSIVPYGPFRASDAEVFLAVGTQGQWIHLCHVLDLDPLIDDPRFATNAGRVEHRDALRMEIEARLARDSARTWMDRFADAGVPCAPINGVQDALREPQIADGDLICDMTLASGSTVKVLGSPLLVDGVRPPIRRRPPQLGEHMDDVADLEEH